MSIDTLALITNLWIMASFLSTREDARIGSLIMGAFWLAVLTLAVIVR